MVLHVAAANETVMKRLHGVPATMTPEEGWPSYENADASSWQTVLDRLSKSHKKLIKALKTVNGDRLDDPIIENFSPVYITVHGNIQHLIYHTGQIMLLKKQ